MKAILPVCLVLFAIPSFPSAVHAENRSTTRDKPLKSETFSGLSFRSLGPAFNSGRVSDVAIHPGDRNTWYVTAASGGVWKTTNAGTTWTPIFDAQGSYSIGCVAIDPVNPLTVWVGAGENNSQRSVGYGDGVYKSTDGGKTWNNMGLKNSEHIGMIAIDPRNTNTVYVAAQGPLWAAGGDRGLYKTLDGGKTWKLILHPGEYTGVSEVHFDPRNPDILYVTAYQRQRRVWTLIDGGPESAIQKSTDGGATWRKLENGLPKEDLGRIGLAISPVDPDVVYAIVEAANKAGGFFRSTDGGGNWEKMSDEVSDSPQYYQEIFADPRAVGRVYSMDTWMQVTEDGGKTFRRVGEKYKHVDNHALWIDPSDTDHLIAGCDGGLYETFDRAATWDFKANLPITQFYKIALDNAKPFYNVYGGTQDNNTLGGPSRTLTTHGITNYDWFVTVGGDGFQTQVDPNDPSIVYSESQHGGLVRFDRRTGEAIDIQPQTGKGEPPLRWNWDSPLLISPHSPSRLYFGANRLFRSDDRGNSWQAVSPDLTRQIDRNRLKVMGRVWSVDAVAKNASTSYYGNIVAFSESPAKEGLLYVGTDDGLIQVSNDGGKNWISNRDFPGVPEMTYVSKILASLHDPDVVYAAFDNHKMGDFKPYLLKSVDHGRSWVSVAGDLPERGTVYAIAEDHEVSDLLFAGTEFGVFFTRDGGRQWVPLKSGIPTIAVRDLQIQRRENDLVAGTFGRGFYVLDDYTPLRQALPRTFERTTLLFPIKPAPFYVPSSPFGLREKSSLGDAFFTAPNPPFGAVFTYYLKDALKKMRATRLEAEKDATKRNMDIYYPSWEQLRAEDREEDPAILVTITDPDGHVVRRLTGPATSGLSRVTWDLRYPAYSPTQLSTSGPDNPFRDPPMGPLAAPGTYYVSLSRRFEGQVTPLTTPAAFTTVPIRSEALSATDAAALLIFQQKTGRLQRAVLGAVESAKEALTRLQHIKKAIDDAPGADLKLGDEARRLELRLKDIQVALSGDPTLESRNEPTPPSIVDRVNQIVEGHWSTTVYATETHHQDYETAAAEFEPVLADLRTVVDQDLKKLEDEAEAAGAPWTPGRVPLWTKE
jgi:photosystem II stability/assembly factor-like uncharacterized protein